MISKDDVVYDKSDLFNYCKDDLISMYLSCLDEIDVLEDKLEVMERLYNSVSKSYQVLNQEYSDLLETINVLESWYY